jgi:hypothetical protein
VRDIDYQGHGNDPLAFVPKAYGHNRTAEAMDDDTRRHVMRIVAECLDGYSYLIMGGVTLQEYGNPRGVAGIDVLIGRGLSRNSSAVDLFEKHPEVVRTVDREVV